MRQKRDDGQAAWPALDPAKLVFVDETGASTNMTRRYGRAPAGLRLGVALSELPFPDGDVLYTKN